MEVDNGSIINAPLPANALRRAIAILGTSETYLKGKMKRQLTKSHLKEQIQSLTPGQIIIEIDLAFIEELVFLFTVCYPGFYCVISYLGHGKGTRSSDNLLPHLLYVFSVYKALKLDAKFISADGEKGFEKLVTEIQTAARLFNKY